MDISEWRVHLVDEQDLMDSLKVFINRKTPQGREILYYNPEDQTITEKLITEGNQHEVKPTLILTKDMAQALFNALQKMGMKPTEQSFVEGKLQATEKHLEDMRTLLFSDEIMVSGHTEIPKPVTPKE